MVHENTTNLNLRALKTKHLRWQHQFHVMRVDLSVAEMVRYQNQQHRDARLFCLREHLAALKACLCAGDTLIEALERPENDDPLHQARSGTERNTLAWTLSRKEKHLQEHHQWSIRSSFLQLSPKDFSVCVLDRGVLDQRAPSPTLADTPARRA